MLDQQLPKNHHRCGHGDNLAKTFLVTINLPKPDKSPVASCPRPGCMPQARAVKSISVQIIEEIKGRLRDVKSGCHEH